MFLLDTFLKIHKWWTCLKFYVVKIAYPFYKISIKLTEIILPFFVDIYDRTPLLKLGF